MTKRYPHPEDEFDLPLDDEVPHGAHRKPRSKWRIVWTTLLVIVLAGALGFGAATYVPRWLGLTADDIADTIGITPTATDTDETSDETPATDDADADQSEDADPADDADTDPAGDDTEVEDGDTEQIIDDEPETLDQSVAVRVLNATRTRGLAARATTALEGAGWSDLTADNYTGTSQVTASVVYYKSAEHRGEAEAIAAELAIDNTLEVPALVGPISVILASDYTG